MSNYLLSPLMDRYGRLCDVTERHSGVLLSSWAGLKRFYYWRCSRCGQNLTAMHTSTEGAWQELQRRPDDLCVDELIGTGV